MRFRPTFGPLPPLPIIHSEVIKTQVFTHRSYYARRTHVFEDHPDDMSPDNEKLEHLGDSVLGLVVTEMLLQMFPGLRVGPLTKTRALVVGNANLAELSLKYKLPERLRLHPAQALTLLASTHVQADVFESFVGGLYADQGLGSVQSWLGTLLPPYAFTAHNIIRKEHGYPPLPSPLAANAPVWSALPPGPMYAPMHTHIPVANGPMVPPYPLPPQIIPALPTPEPQLNVPTFTFSAMTISPDTSGKPPPIKLATPETNTNNNGNANGNAHGNGNNVHLNNTSLAISVNPLPPHAQANPIYPYPYPPRETPGYLALFNQCLQKQNKMVEWSYSDGDVFGLQGSATDSSADSPPGAPVADPIEMNVRKGRGTKTTPIWSAKVLVEREEFGIGRGNTKKAAKNEAAKIGLVKLGVIVW